MPSLARLSAVIRLVACLAALPSCTAILGDFSAGEPDAGLRVDGAALDRDGAVVSSPDASSRPDGSFDGSYPPDTTPGDAAFPPDGSPIYDGGTAVDGALPDASADTTHDAAPDAIVDAGWDGYSLVCTATFQDTVIPTVDPCIKSTTHAFTWSWYCGGTPTTPADTSCYLCSPGVPCTIPAGDPTSPPALGMTSLP